VAAWLARDPIAHYRDHLLSIGVTEATLAGVEADALREVDEATAAAKAAKPADASYVERDVWADGSSTWRN
jgi:TPP-dependent pyruvate/acetoin dehydrogenase alpha subunit